MGFGVVLYANAALEAALKSVHDVLSSLKRNGSLDEVRDRLASFDERRKRPAKIATTFSKPAIANDGASARSQFPLLGTSDVRADMRSRCKLTPQRTVSPGRARLVQ